MVVTTVGGICGILWAEGQAHSLLNTLKSARSTTERQGSRANSAEDVLSAASREEKETGAKEGANSVE